MKNKIKAITLSKIDEEWEKVTYNVPEEKRIKVKRKRINAKTPPPFKRTGGKKPGRQLNYKFKDPDD